MTVHNSQFCEEYPVIYSYIENNVAYDSGTSFDSGDVNADGTVDIVDVLALNKYLLGVHELDDSGRKYADVNNDGKIDDSDSMAILKSVVGLAE